MAKRVISVRCPTCRKIVLQKEPEFPFCSERCRLIDLGKWASGGYVISTSIAEADQFGEGPSGGGPGAQHPGIVSRHAAREKAVESRGEPTKGSHGRKR